MKVEISEIKKKRDVFPRVRLNEDAIERYMTLYEQGKTKALTVQKGTKVLIDGFHRLEALKRLGKEYVGVEDRDLPDSELLVEAYLMNKGHGVPITREERNNLIIKLRFDQERTLEEIAKTVDLRADARFYILGLCILRWERRELKKLNPQKGDRPFLWRARRESMQCSQNNI